MQATNSQIIAAIPALTELAKSPVNFTTAHHILMAINTFESVQQQVQHHIKNYRNDLLNQIEIPENVENMTEAELKKVMEQITTMDLVPIKLCDLDHLRITTEEFIKIHWLMKD